MSLALDNQTRIRWIIRADLEDVVEIEQASFEFPWTRDDFCRCLEQRNCIGMVAEQRNQVVGFMVYELHRKRLHLLNLATCPEVRERNLDAQLFLRAMGFRAVNVLRGFYDDTPEDAYVFCYRLRAP